VSYWSGRAKPLGLAPLFPQLYRVHICMQKGVLMLEYDLRLISVRWRLLLDTAERRAALMPMPHAIGRVPCCAGCCPSLRITASYGVLSSSRAGPMARWATLCAA
jgi:hypothetical protein